MADHSQSGAPTSAPWHHDRGDPRIGTCRRRNRADIIYSSGILPASTPMLYLRFNHGSSISSFCNLHPNSWYACGHPVWDRTGSPGFCPWYEHPGYYDPLQGEGKATMVTGNFSNLDEPIRKVESLEKQTSNISMEIALENPKIIVDNLNVQYSDGTESLKDIYLAIPESSITVLFGPAGGGKSTLLRTLNRLNDLADVTRLSGKILVDGENIVDPRTDVIALRRKIGMVFARPVVLPMTIRENLVYGLELKGERKRERQDLAVEESLQAAALWDEVKDRLNEPAVSLSGGQQQRLCLARVLALQPEIILLDEPTSGLDPISTGKVEASLQELKEDYTIVLVPHSIQQAARVAEYAAFFLDSEMVEYARGEDIFVNPRDQRTHDYIAGRFG